MEVRVSERDRRQAENDAAVGADDGLGVFAVSAKVLEVPSTSDGLHQWIEHHHGFGADSASVLVDRTAVGAAVLIADLLTVTAVVLGVVSAQEALDLYLESVQVRSMRSMAEAGSDFSVR